VRKLRLHRSRITVQHIQQTRLRISRWICSKVVKLLVSASMDKLHPGSSHRFQDCMVFIVGEQQL